MLFYADPEKRHEILNKQMSKNIRNIDYVKISKMLDEMDVETKFSNNYIIKYITY